MKILQLLTHSALARDMGADILGYGEDIGEYVNPTGIDNTYHINAHREKRAVFNQFKEVKLGDVWNEAKSEKVVSYTIARDITQYLAVQLMWVSLHLLLWKGPATQLVDIVTREDDIREKDFTENVDLSKITTFFTNPQTVARNLLVCTSFFLITSTFWFLPSLMWKSSSTSKADSLVDITETVYTAEERVSGIVSAIANRGVADIYNRVLCPTCVVQIIFINTMLITAQLIFWSVITFLPNAG